MVQNGAPRAAGAAATPIAVAVDAMSGDHDPRAAVRGALEVALEGATRVLLVGDPARLQAELDDGRRVLADRSERAAELLRTQVEIVAAGSVIAMDEHPAQAVRSKRDASVVVATRLVADGRAQAAVSAGNSGATLAAALLTVGRIRGVARPAIGATFPSATTPTFLLDVGANVDCKPLWLLQFAVMGDVYARLIMGVPEPRVGLLSNGEEAEKGSELVQEAHRLLAASGLHFAGNVEGRDVFGGSCDVVVTDGFTGNVVLKTAEGVAELLFGSISSAARASLTGKARRRPPQAPPPPPARPGRLPQGRGSPPARGCRRGGHRPRPQRRRGDRERDAGRGRRRPPAGEREDRRGTRGADRGIAGGRRAARTPG